MKKSASNRLEKLNYYHTILTNGELGYIKVLRIDRNSYDVYLKDVNGLVISKYENQKSKEVICFLKAFKVCHKRTLEQIRNMKGV